jgi:hypothetical protein
MRDSELPAEARRLARPCALLQRVGAPDKLAGVWGGPGVVPAKAVPLRHWLSVDCRFLPSGLGPPAGVLSIYTNEEDCVSGVVAFDPAATVAVSPDAPLYAHSAMSLPPPDAWPGGATEAYIRLWHSRCPLYTGEAAAVLGGWHFPWPDGDWEELREQPLLVWTLEESEPWVEVWRVPAGYRVIQRIT